MLPINIRDLTGQKFGRLKVERYNEERSTKGHAYWECLCECGTRKVIRGNKLTAKVNPTISCGCYRAEPIVRANARNQLTAEERSAAAGGTKVRETPADKPAPVKRVPKPKRDPLPVRADYVPSQAALAARGPVPPPAPPPPAPPRIAPSPVALVLPPAASARKTLWVAICSDREGGHRLHLRLERGNTHSEMTGRRERAPSDLRRAATRLFGPLNWMTREQAGLSGQPWVLEIAPVYISRSESE